MNRSKKDLRLRKRQDLEFDSVHEVFSHYFPEDKAESNSREGNKRGVAVGKRIFGEIAKSFRGRSR
jgi:hypothetical protein